jgi:hypothetical protein
MENIVNKKHKKLWNNGHFGENKKLDYAVYLKI